jgi:hypothetical protein
MRRPAAAVGSRRGSLPWALHRAARRPAPPVTTSLMTRQQVWCGRAGARGAAAAGASVMGVYFGGGGRGLLPVACRCPAAMLQSSCPRPSHSPASPPCPCPRPSHSPASPPCPCPWPSHSPASPPCPWLSAPGDDGAAGGEGRGEDGAAAPGPSSSGRHGHAPHSHHHAHHGSKDGRGRSGGGGHRHHDQSPMSPDKPAVPPGEAAACPTGC